MNSVELRRMYNGLMEAVTAPGALQRVILREHAILDEAETAYNRGDYARYQRWMQRLTNPDFQVRRSERIRRRRLR